MNSLKNANEDEKLLKVNNFFNQVTYKSDMSVWGVKDYWATRMEFLGRDKGDCEEYATAKYFTLKQLGVPTSKMYLSYVKATKQKIAHMVLTYYHKPGATPIVLDNVNKKLKLASKRTDLRPIYSFNASGLWQAKNKGKSSQKVGRNNLKNWKSLMNRI